MKVPAQSIQAEADRHVLLVAMPTYFHPAWERFIAGERVGKFDFYKLKLWQKMLISWSFVRHTVSNPRNAEYIAKLAASFLAEHGEATFDLLVDSEAATELPEDLMNTAENVWISEKPKLRGLSQRDREALKVRHYAKIVLLYADANGLGWSHAENIAASLTPSALLVLNGRKRVFELDLRTRRRLLWRRFLEWSSLLEISMGLSLFVYAIPLAVYDATFGRLKRGT